VIKPKWPVGAIRPVGATPQIGAIGPSREYKEIKLYGKNF